MSLIYNFDPLQNTHAAIHNQKNRFYIHSGLDHL